MMANRDLPFRNNDERYLSLLANTKSKRPKLTYCPFR